MATPVEATSAPKLHEVVEEFQTCHGDWYLIGVYLKLSAAELDTVEANNPKVVMRFTRMITRWLKNKTNPSWADLVGALRKINEHALADRIAMNYCQPEENQPVVMVESKLHDASKKQPNGHNKSLPQAQLDPPLHLLASLSTQDQSVAPLPVEDDIQLDNLSEREMCDIGFEFSFMFLIVVQLLNRVVPVEALKSFLSSFRHPSSGLPYVPPQLYGHCSTTAQVLKALEPLYINSMHTYLLRKIVIKFGCERSQRAVKEYDEKLPRKATLKHLGDPIPEWMISACHGAKRIVVVVKGESDTITRGDVEDIQVALERDLEVDRVVIVFAKQEPGNSVALTFLVPECVSVLDSIRNDGQKLMDLAASGVMRIEAEGDTIEVEVEGKLWMHRMMRMKDSDELSVDSGFGGSVVGSRRSSFSEGDPSDAPTRDDEEALKFAADLIANRTTPSRRFVTATISDRAAAALRDGLSNNQSLRELELLKCKISSVGVASLATALSSNTFLKTLRLRNCRITDDSMVELSQALLQNKTLEELDLSSYVHLHNYNTITPIGVTSLSEALLSNKSLKTLDLYGNKIADQGTCLIADSLHGNETLQSLNLGRNNISNQGATALAKLLETNRSIKTLDLWGNKIADQGTCSIADALHGNETLQSLDLGRNNISDQGATALAKLLETNRSIKTLNLRGNEIGGQGVCSIADTLHGNETLQSLNLSFNNITDVGICALSAALPINKSLQYLVLSLSDIFNHYRVTDEGVKVLASGLEGSTSLKTLKLYGTRHISPEAKKILRDSAQRRGIELIL